MVESYSKNANHNMRRPVVKEEIVDLMRQRQKQVTGSLKELEDFCPQGKYSHYSPWNGSLFPFSHGNNAA